VDLVLDSRRQSFLKDNAAQTAKVPSVQQTDSWLAWSLLEALLLMWNSARPVAAGLCKALNMTAMAEILLMTFHAVVDLTLVVAALILCSTAHPANRSGAAIGMIADFAQQILCKCAEYLAETGLGTADSRTGQLLARHWSDFLRQRQFTVWLQEMKQDVLPALAISPWNLLCISIGILLFGLVSSATALLVAPREASVSSYSMANVGVVGPLCLCAEVPKQKVALLVPALRLLLLQRSCLCTSLIILAWWNTGAEDTALWYASLFNEDMSTGQRKRQAMWLGLVILHSGLAAVMQMHAASLRLQDGKQAGAARLDNCALGTYGAVPIPAAS